MKMPLEVLLVEDNEGDVDLTRRALQGDTCNLVVANDGVQAADYLSKHGKFANATTPNLILLDLNMPRMNGKQLLAMLKEDEKLKTIPIVILTSSQARTDILECYALHANCYIVKPFDGKVFMERVQSVVNYWKNLALLPHEVANL